MIVTLPDPETTRHIEPQPPTPFRFVWDVLFSSRKKLKLTPEDVEELNALDRQIDPWRKASSLLDVHRCNPQGGFDAAVSRLMSDPSEQNIDRLLLLRWTESR